MSPFAALRSRFAHPIPPLAGVLSLVIGELVLFGWAIDQATLQSLASGLLSMSPNAALAFVLTGASLLSFAARPETRSTQLVGLGCAAGVTGIGMISGLEYLLNWNPGLEEWLVGESPDTAGPWIHRRMGPNTAICLLLLGSALFLKVRRERYCAMLREGLAQGAMLLAFGASLGYLYDKHLLHGIGQYTPMTLHTAVTIFVVGLGILFLHPDRGMMAVITSERAGGHMLRRLLPGALLILPAVGWVRLYGERQGIYGTSLGVAIFAALGTVALVGLLWWAARSLDEVDRQREQISEARRGIEERHRRAQFAVVEDITMRKSMEQALRESEDRYSSLVSHATDIIYTAGPDGRFTFVNAAACRIMGFPEEELLGKHYLELIRPDWREAAQRFYKLQVAERTPSTYYEFPAITRNGDEVWVGQWVQLRIVEGRLVGVEAIARDITDRKRSEQELRRSQAFIASVVEHLPNMIFVKDAKDLRFVQFNRAGEELLGYSRGELIGKCDYDFFPREEADFFTQKDRDVLESGRLVDIPEEPIQTKHQGIRSLHTKKIPLYDETGQPQYLLGISEDITERKKAEHILEERAKCAAFAADVSLMLNRDEPLDCQLQYCTDAAVKYLGVAFTRIWLREPGDLCAQCHKASWCRDHTECLHLHASAGISTNLNGEYRRVPLGALKIGRIAQGEGALFTNDILQDDRLANKAWMQENRLQSFAGFPLMVEGQVFGVLALFGREPLSEAVRQTIESVCNGLAAAIARNRAESALQRAYERLRALTRQLSEAQEGERRRIARELHDEFGQVLTGLKFDLAWLIKRLSHLNGSADAAAIRAKAAAMSQSVDGLIQSVRATAAALRPSVLDDLGPVAAIEWLAASFHERTGLPCELAIEPGVREKAIGSELATTVFRSAQELLTNVMRHAEASTVAIRLTMKEGQLNLIVRDNGQGIRREDWEQSRSLGLRGLHERVKLIGGTVTIVGSHDTGTEVSVLLPIEGGMAQVVKESL